MTLNKLKIGQTIGIIGGGQLGKMMAQSAQRMGFKVAVLDPDDTCPARHVSHHFIHAGYNDIEALNQLGEYSDVITYEFENISAEALKEIVDKYHVPQGYETVLTLQNRLAEKEAIKSSGAAVVPYMKVASYDDLVTAVSTLGLPIMLKTTFGGYDGKGQMVINTPEDMIGAKEMIQAGLLVAEKRIELDFEISITASRNEAGEISYFPVQENVHRDQILFSTTVKYEHPYTKRAIMEVEKIMKHIHFVGTFTVEFFIDKSGELYVNEIAPRPHNSGHYSIEACEYSQFDTHILSIANWKMPKVKLLSEAVMYNLLGQDIDLMEDLFDSHPEWHVHVYGKEVRKHNRKMGHITLLLDSHQDSYYPIYKERV